MNTSLSSEEQVVDLNETISDDDNDNNELTMHNSVSFEYTDEHSYNYNEGRWTKDEQYRFMEGIMKYKNDWKNIQMNIRTRSSTQVRSHAQKFFLMCKKVLLLCKGGMLDKYENRKIINNIFDTVFKGNDYTPDDEFYTCIEKMIFNTDKHKTHKRSDNKHCKRNNNNMKVNSKDVMMNKVQMIFNITKSHKRNNNSNNDCECGCEVNSNVNTQVKLLERNPFNITFDINGNDLTNISSDHSCSNINMNINDDYVFETYAYQFDMNSNEKEIENESVEYLYKCDVNNS